MKIYELEVSNYKSLENYGMPLRFSNLNLLIGENDAGKSSLLEIIQILFDKRNINIIDFYDKDKEIKIKAKLIDGGSRFLNKIMDTEDYIQDDDNEPISVIKSFIDGLKTLKDFSFYDDLVAFYEHYIENFTVVKEKIYKIEKNKIVVNKKIWFDYPINLDKSLDSLIANKDFINFMVNSIKIINRKNKDDLEERIQIGEIEYYNNTDIAIAYRLSMIISSTNNTSVEWNNQEDIYKIFTVDKITYRGKEEFDIRNPFVYFLGTEELSYNEISKKIYNDNFGLEIITEGDIGENFYLEIYDFLNSKLKEYIFDKISSSIVGANYFLGIIETFNSYINKLSKNKIDLNFVYALNKNLKDKNNLEPSLEINTIEKNRSIDISNKSQGFLRKLLICSFLLLTKEWDDLSNTTGQPNKIILLEEPELHMHMDAQKEIITVLKENLIESNSQVFITTHSHTIIEGIELTNIYVFQKDQETGLASIKNTKQIGGADKEEVIESIISSLGIKNTDLLFLRKVILITEGVMDISFIKGLFKRPEIGIDLDKILFINAAGGVKIPYYIGLGAFLNKKTFIVSDKHNFNIKNKEYFENNTLIQGWFKKEVSFVVLNKKDILDYLDFSEVANYIGFSLKPYNMGIHLKDILEKENCKNKLTPSVVEYLSSKIKNIDIELLEIIEKISIAIKS